MKKMIIALFFLLVLVNGAFTAQGQDGGVQFQWNSPLNAGEMPQNAPFLPPATTMPTLPLEEPLVAGTLFFNIESFSNEYSIMNVTLDPFENRFFAFNITNRYGVHPISPNGRYGMYTFPDGSIDAITCVITDLTTQTEVDRFETYGGCNQNNVRWSPDSTRILYQARDDQGRSALGIRRDGQTSIFRPIPSSESDLGGATINDESFFTPRGWVNNQLFYFEVATGATVSEYLYAQSRDPLLAEPVTDLLFEETLQRILLSRPAQPPGELYRGVMLTDVVTGYHFSVAPPGHVASAADLAPDGNLVVYWAETKTELGTTHPLRLAIYDPETDQQTVLLQFNGPTDSYLLTRPGRLVWHDEGIYFHIEQQPGAGSNLQTGTYRIQPDGSSLEFVTPELLWSSLDR